jgi:hypothetical protein
MKRPGADSAVRNIENVLFVFVDILKELNNRISNKERRMSKRGPELHDFVIRKSMFVIRHLSVGELQMELSLYAPSSPRIKARKRSR